MFAWLPLVLYDICALFCFPEKKYCAWLDASLWEIWITFIVINACLWMLEVNVYLIVPLANKLVQEWELDHLLSLWFCFLSAVPNPEAPCHFCTVLPAWQLCGCNFFLLLLKWSKRPSSLLTQIPRILYKRWLSFCMVHFDTVCISVFMQYTKRCRTRTNVVSETNVCVLLAMGAHVL